MLGAIGLALVTACRGKEAATPTDAVVQFTPCVMRSAFRARRRQELAALRPFIADTLARGPCSRTAYAESDKRRAPDEKPGYVEGDLFSSVFEDRRRSRHADAVDQCAVRAGGVHGRTCETGRSVDRHGNRDRERGRLVVQDVRYGGRGTLRIRDRCWGNLSRSP
jgi:hypothetical protein